MEKTKQGVLNLNSLGGGSSKKHLNGRRDKQQMDCAHLFEDYVDDNYTPFRKCVRCSFEE